MFVEEMPTLPQLMSVQLYAELNVPTSLPFLLFEIRQPNWVISVHVFV
jgi:hypothetical protein